MRRSLRGHPLPESEQDFALLYGQQCLQFYHCANCKGAFPGRVTSVHGWRETQLSGYCETCYDELCDAANIAFDEAEKVRT